MRKKNLYVVGVDKDGEGICGGIEDIRYAMPTTKKGAQEVFRRMEEIDDPSCPVTVYKLVKVNLEKE